MIFYILSNEKEDVIEKKQNKNVFMDTLRHLLLIPKIHEIRFDV